jgi:hypothetical protein
MVNKILTTEIDVLTGVIVEREMTADEIANQKKLNSEATNRAAAIEAQIAARESALAKLADLGLTAEEIAAL